MLLAGSCFAVCQTRGVIPRIRMFNSDHSVGRSMNIFCVIPHNVQWHEGKRGTTSTTNFLQGKKNRRKNKDTESTKTFLEGGGDVNYSRIFGFCGVSWNLAPTKREGRMYCPSTYTTLSQVMSSGLRAKCLYLSFSFYVLTTLPVVCTTGIMLMLFCDLEL